MTGPGGICGNVHTFARCIPINLIGIAVAELPGNAVFPYCREGKVAFTLTPMNVGQSAKRLVEKGVLVVAAKENDKKSYYTKA